MLLERYIIYLFFQIKFYKNNDWLTTYLSIPGFWKFYFYYSTDHRTELLSLFGWNIFSLKGCF